MRVLVSWVHMALKGRPARARMDTVHLLVGFCRRSVHLKETKTGQPVASEEYSDLVPVSVSERSYCVVLAPSTTLWFSVITCHERLGSRASSFEVKKFTISVSHRAWDVKRSNDTGSMRQS